MKGHANLPVFVPHAGCPNRCVFCDQRAISGRQAAPAPGDVYAFCREGLDRLHPAIPKAEIAFFGGSFTAIPREAMTALLEAVQPLRRHPRFGGIRASTRPDAVDAERLELLKARGVTALELGAQSMDDRVLELNRRGHTAADTVNAARLIRGAGLELGCQIMLGMYGDSPGGFLRTVESICALQPDTVRVYPVTVLRGTPLEALWRAGEYTPPTIEEAVELGAKSLRRFTASGVRVIRMGLHASAEVEQKALAGVCHPAFRELCESRVLLDAALEQLSERPAGEYTALVARGARSKMIGQKRSNLRHLAAMGYRLRVEERPQLGYLELFME